MEAVEAAGVAEMAKLAEMAGAVEMAGVEGVVEVTTVTTVAVSLQKSRGIVAIWPHVQRNYIRLNSSAEFRGQVKWELQPRAMSGNLSELIIMSKEEKES